MERETVHLSQEDMLLYGRAVKRLCHDDAVCLAEALMECQENFDAQQITRILECFPQFAFEDAED